MLCAVPFRDESRRVEYPCGQCLCCRINKRREWASRIILEAASHQNVEWITLTYSPECLPTGGTLVPSHLSSWLRSLRTHLRRKYQITGLRFFGVGEYGSRTKRPHYHVFLFGLPHSLREEASRLWKYGHVMWAHDPVNSKIAEYTAGYTVKKEGKDAEKLAGRHPEFSRMSLRPPIGARFAESFGEGLASDKFAVEDIHTRGFPTSVSMGGKMVPLGRTLSRYLRKGMGYAEPCESEKRSAAWLRAQLFDNAEYQAERSRRRSAGVLKAASRQKLFGKKDLI